jgi:hypothetical protein
MTYSTTRAGKARSRSVTCLEPYSSYGFVLACSEGDPRERSSGLPCPSAYFRLFSSKPALEDAICWEKGLNSPEAIAAALPTLGAVYVRALDVVGLDVVRIPRHLCVRSSSLDRGDRSQDPSWGIFQRCLSAVDGSHPGGVIVEDDPRATSIFIARDSLGDHTRLDRVEPVALSTLLSVRVGLDPDSLAPEPA